MREPAAGASWKSSPHVIKKLIRKLFGQESPKEDAPATAPLVAASGDDTKPARKSTRKKAAPPEPARDPDVPVILPAEVHGIDPSLISKNAMHKIVGPLVGIYSDVATMVMANTRPA